MAGRNISAVDGIGYKDLTSIAGAQPGLLAGRKFYFLGQTDNRIASNVANQGIGTVALPALAAGATGTVTITDSLITFLSIVLLTVKRGTTTPAAGALAAITVSGQQPSSGSVVVDIRNNGSVATLATDYVLHYLATN